MILDNHVHDTQGVALGYLLVGLSGRFIVVGVDVKKVNLGADKPVLLINAISTVFGKEGKLAGCEDEIYRSEKLNPQQASLLERPASSRYPLARDSGCKYTKES